MDFRSPGSGLSPPNVILLEVFNLLLINRLVRHHSETSVVMDLSFATDVLDDCRVTSLVLDGYVQHGRRTVWQHDRFDLELDRLCASTASATVA